MRPNKTLLLSALALAAFPTPGFSSTRVIAKEPEKLPGTKPEIDALRKARDKRLRRQIRKNPSNYSLTNG